MAAIDRLALEIAGHTANDPDAAERVSVLLAVRHAGLIPVLEGKPTQRGDRVLLYEPRIRRKAVIETWGFAAWSDDIMQDYSVYLKLVEQVLTLPYRWIRRAWRSGTDESAGYIPRADYDHTDLSVVPSSPTLWNLKTDTPPGNCPFLFAPEDVEASYEGGGIYSLEFTVMEVDPEGVL